MMVKIGGDPPDSKTEDDKKDPAEDEKKEPAKEEIKEAINGSD